MDLTTHPAYMPPIQLRPLAPSDGSSNDSHAIPSSPVIRKKKFSCHTCRVSYKNSSSLGRHNREKHGTVAVLDCRHCGRTFQRPEGVRNHIVKNRCSAASTFHHQPRLIHDTDSAYPILEAFSNSSNNSSPSDAMTIDSAPNSSYFGVCAGAICPPNFVHRGDSTSTHINKHVLPQEVSLTSATRSITSNGFSQSGLQRQERLDRAESHLSELDNSAKAQFVFKRPKKFFRLGKVFRVIWKEPNPFQEQREQDERDKTRCTIPRHPCRPLLPPAFEYPPPTRCTIPRHPCRPLLPPAFEYPPPQDLEYLLLQQRRAKRRVRVINSFRAKHSRFSSNAPEDINAGTADAWGSRIMRHQTNIKQAWKDGVEAARRLLSGTLPTELHSVLGVAQVASAIRSASDDIDSPVASEDKFLSDLSRWRRLLPSDSHAAFNHFADTLWDHRPPSDLAWSEAQDAETLLYFQDLLAEMLSHIGSSTPKKPTFGSALFQSERTSPLSLAPATAIHPPSFSDFNHHEALPEVGDAIEIPFSNELKHTNLAEFALYSAGAIFALILAYLLLYTCHFSVQVLCLCFITTSPPDYGTPNRLRWLQHVSLLANCRLLELLIQQLGMDRSFDDSTLVANTPDQYVQRPTILGGLSWQQLIARCFEDTVEDTSVMSDV